MNALFINIYAINVSNSKSFMQQQNFISVILKVSFMNLHTMNSYNTTTLLVRILIVTSPVIVTCQAEKLSEELNPLEKLFAGEFIWYWIFVGKLLMFLTTFCIIWRICCYPYFRPEYVSSKPFIWAVQTPNKWWVNSGLYSV